VVGFWAAAVSADLSPGDLLVGALVGASVFPTVPLKSKTYKAGETAWSATPWSSSGDGRGHFLANGRMTSVMVISHSCEIDKQDGTKSVLVAPAFPMTNLQSDHQAVVRNGERHAFLHIPEVTGQAPESYVDLRSIAYLPRPMINALKRVASATGVGQNRLEAQLIGFFTRIDLDKLKAKLSV